MKYIAFDYGEKRVGYAVSDALGSMAFPRGVVLKNTRDAFFADILLRLAEEQAEAIVIGLPRRLDGSESLTTRQVCNFAASLMRRVELPVYFVDEAYSSAEAEAMLRESGQKLYTKKGGRSGRNGQSSGLKSDGRIDSLAAARFLDSFLNLPEAARISAADYLQKTGR